MKSRAVFSRRALSRESLSSSAAAATRAGFTLTELLVVLGIIAILAGILTPSLMAMRKKAQRNEAALRIQRIEVALGSYQGDFGDYPPTSIDEEYTDFTIGGNGVNDGAESLLGHLATQDQGGPYLGDVPEEWIENTDEDAVGDPAFVEKIRWIYGDAQLREIVDPWGNPYVYFHNRDYERTYGVLSQCTADKPKTLNLTAQRSEKLQTWHHPTGFQIWSLGPDEKNETGDDIGSW